MSSNLQPKQLVEQAVKHAANGKLADAIAHAKAAIKTDPKFYPGWLALSKFLFEAGYFSEAVQVGRAAEQFDPLQSEFAAIQRHMQSGDIASADRDARQMLKRIPGHPRAVFTVAQVAGMKNYPEGRVEALRYGLEHTPANLVLRNFLISAQEEAGDYAGAIETARTLVRTEESFESFWSLVSVLLRHGRNEELLGVLDRAEAKAKGDREKISEVDLVRGQILRVIGRRDDSVAAYRRSLQNTPKNAGAWWALADMKTFTFSDQDEADIRSLLKAEDVSPSQRCVATFALAKASEGREDWAATMALYDDANRLHSKARFDPNIYADEITARIKGADADALRVQASDAASGPRPIFILGLPRAGSTLLEQILASHSQIEGTIEQPVMPSVARMAHVKCAMAYNGTLLNNLADLSPADLTELGQAYIDNGALFRSQGMAYFTDKQPFNFLNIGLIHKILPQAAIIDIRRNPLDSGFSLYRQHFLTGVDFSYDLRHIGAFYNGYLKLMDHWHSVLPGRVLTVQYETLVRDPEPAIRKVLDYIDVPFEPACLEFHKTSRAVRTASSEQVRQPINTRGIGAWRKVDAHLQPLKDALGPETLARFEGLYDA